MTDNKSNKFFIVKLALILFAITFIATLLLTVCNYITKDKIAELALQNAEKATERANTAAEACEEIVDGTGLISTTEKGVANGVATLDSNGTLASSQFPNIVIYSETEPEVTDTLVSWMQPY